MTPPEAWTHPCSARTLADTKLPLAESRAFDPSQACGDRQFAWVEIIVNVGREKYCPRRQSPVIVRNQELILQEICLRLARCNTSLHMRTGSSLYF